MQTENKDADEVVFGYMFGISIVGEDGECPIQHEALFGAREAALSGKLRWYHRNSCPLLLSRGLLF